MGLGGGMLRGIVCRMVRDWCFFLWGFFFLRGGVQGMKDFGRGVFFWMFWAFGEFVFYAKLGKIYIFI